MKLSLFASSVRPDLWEAFFRSLEGTTVDVEVVFAGNIDITKWYSKQGNKSPSGAIDYVLDSDFRYITTGDIKPAQCYEIARRSCTGDLILWVADDCEFPDDVLGKACRYFEENCTRKDIVSIQSKENYHRYELVDMSMHSFFGGRRDTPRMAMLGLMDREYLEELGGIDARYVCGQYENDITMRVYENGGKLYPFGGKDCYIDIDHKNKHGGLTQDNPRPFAKGYKIDRSVLEGSWVKDGKVMDKRIDKVIKFEDKDILTKSQNNNLEELWV